MPRLATLPSRGRFAAASFPPGALRRCAEGSQRCRPPAARCRLVRPRGALRCSGDSTRCHP
eukprot:5687004-Pyramimonas_sp.AAC.1